MTQPDHHQKAPRDINETLAILEKSPGMLVKGCLVIFVMGLLFFSGFASIGLFFLSQLEKEFYRTALKTTAVVTGTEERRQVDRTGSGTESYTVRYVSIIDLSFENLSGETINTRTSDGENSLLITGDEVQIFYDPENPKDVRFAKNKNAPRSMQLLLHIFLGVFVALSLVAFLLTRNKPGKAL